MAFDRCTGRRLASGRRSDPVPYDRGESKMGVRDGSTETGGRRSRIVRRRGNVGGSSPLARLGEAEFVARLDGVAREIAAAGVIRFPNPIGLPTLVDQV